jgi:hypothetical protein
VRQPLLQLLLLLARAAQLTRQLGTTMVHMMTGTTTLGQMGTTTLSPSWTTSSSRAQQLPQLLVVLVLVLVLRLHRAWQQLRRKTLKQQQRAAAGLLRASAGQ